ncbi:hypothetical protein AGMMS49944_01050 [Spirochaetia bacterium]|nr:hypothetical protein AGMMS49944_01050 [Spirochaetia bacterium]
MAGEIELTLKQFIDAHLISELGPKYKAWLNAIPAINENNKKYHTRNEEIVRALAEKESRIATLEKVLAECAKQIQNLSGRLEIFEKKEEQERKAESDHVITLFNKWAVNPLVGLPAAFTFLAGDFRIRTTQQLIQTPEETKWITNREGSRKYLLPNPCFFDQMTDISALYKMEQSMLNEKGKNKIKIITPCEMTNSGYIEFKGELKIL